MLSSLIPLFILLVFIAAVIFVFVGSNMVTNLPLVQRLRDAREALAPVPLSKPVKRGTMLIVLCRRLLVDLTEPNAYGVAPFAHRSAGDVIQIVHYRDRSLKRIIHELRTYAFLLAMLGFIGFLKQLSQARFPPTFAKLWEAMKADPFHTLALFEFTMLLLFSFRLVVELYAIKELLEE